MARSQDRHKQNARTHFALRTSQRLDLILSKSAQKKIKENILLGKYTKFGFINPEPHRQKYLVTYENKLYIMVYDKILKELVTIYEYQAPKEKRNKKYLDKKPLCKLDENKLIIISATKSVRNINHFHK